MVSARLAAFAQGGAPIRFAWGEAGLRSLRDASDVVVIVDVLSFSTSIDIAVSRGARVYPYSWKDNRAEAFARRMDAVLAGKPGSAGVTLSPSSLGDVGAGDRVVMPSPNGSHLSAAASGLPTLTGCLRNAAAVSGLAQAMGARVTVIGAGERWPDGSLRPAAEDLLGAGAIISGLEGKRSVEALLAERVFESNRAELASLVERCVSGRELLGKGQAVDVGLAVEMNVSTSSPILVNGAFEDGRR